MSARRSNHRHRRVPTKLRVLCAAAVLSLVGTSVVGTGSVGATPATSIPANRAVTDAPIRAAVTQSEPQTMPVAPADVILTQPDGSSFTATPWGNGSLNGYAVGDHTIQQDPNGVWHFVSGLDAAGAAILSHARPERTEAPAGTPRNLRPTDAKRGGPPSSEGRTGPTRAPHEGITGSHAVLVILAQFDDRPSVGSTPAQWAASFFGSAPSVRDYYADQSNGLFDLVPATETSGTANDGVVGWVDLGIDHPNPQNSDRYGQQDIARRAIIAADSSVDFSAYDIDGDGAISSDELAIVVIAAGYETAYGGTDAACGPSVWGHEWQIGAGATGLVAPTVDGVEAGGGSYAEFGEWHCSSSDTPGHRTTIGMMVHELGHAYGMPDLYDVYGGRGIGSWSSMATGSWNKSGGYDGSLPAGLDPLMKAYQGWSTPEQLSGHDVQKSLGQGQVLQLRDNPDGVDWSFESHSGTGEYFLVENRQQVGYDAGVPGCGVLIWHVDESSRSDNGTNSDYYGGNLLRLEQADGLDNANFDDGDEGDPYPGTSHNTSFGADTNPNSLLNDGSDSGVSVTVPDEPCAMSVDLTISTEPGTVTPDGTGMLRVTTSPALPSQITVDGHIADTWSLDWVKIAAGTHEVCFASVPGFTTPDCQTVTVTDGNTTTTVGTFVQRGYLEVTTSPPVPAVINVDGIARDTWGIHTDIPTGTHEVCFGDVSEFRPPQKCQTVEVTAGETTTVVGRYIAAPQLQIHDDPRGVLRVTTSPAVPSQITVDGIIRDTWGVDWLPVELGTHEVCFSHVEGWTEPDCQTVEVTRTGATVVGTFTQRGFLHVTTTPAVPATITIDGHPADDWGVYTDHPTGTYEVCFGLVPGYGSPPACQTVDVVAGETTEIIGDYGGDT